MAPEVCTVTIWTMEIRTPSADTLARWHAVLSPAETARTERYRFDTDRNAYIAAHALTRGLLQAIGGRPAASWQFQETESGKPEIMCPAEEPTLQFSLSHTRQLVACAATQGFALGIDAEALDRPEVGTSVVEAVLSPSEIALLNAAPARLRHRTFLQLWTLREAYVKATGKGIHFPREDFSFALDPLDISFAGGDGDASEWQFFAWNASLHMLSLAIRCNQRHRVTLRKRTLVHDELL